MNSEEKLYHCRKWLSRKYHIEALSLKDIAKECNVGPTTIRVFCIKFNIKRRRAGPPCLHSVKAHFDIPPNLKQAIELACQKTGLKKSETYRQALVEYLIKKGINPFEGG